MRDQANASRGRLSCFPTGDEQVSAKGQRSRAGSGVQLGQKRMTTTDEHYNDRDMDDLKKAAELVERAFILSFAPDC
jgi:hypothetical protein